MQYT